MRFNLRKLFAVVTILCLLIGIFNRPLRWIINAGLDNHLVQAFLNPFRHLAWMAGVDVKYFAGTEVISYAPGTRFSDVETGAAIVGTACSMAVHVFLAIVVWVVIEDIWNRAKSKKQ